MRLCVRHRREATRTMRTAAAAHHLLCTIEGLNFMLPTTALCCPNDEGDGRDATHNKNNDEQQPCGGRERPLPSKQVRAVKTVANLR
jgi:hypothetical protein